MYVTQINLTFDFLKRCKDIKGFDSIPNKFLRGILPYQNRE